MLSKDEGSSSDDTTQQNHVRVLFPKPSPKNPVPTGQWRQPWAEAEFNLIARQRLITQGTGAASFVAAGAASSSG